MKPNPPSSFVVALVLALGAAPAHAVSQDVSARADPAVAKAVTEAAAEASGPEAAPDPVRSRALASLSAMQRRCSVLESAALVAVVATCIRGGHCVSPDVPPPSPAVRPRASCYVFRPSGVQ